MIFRQFSLIIAKYLAIALCIITVLLTTPWGSQLTLLVLNNIDGITIDYHSGALVRDIRLNSFHLQSENLDISVEGLSTELDFSCSWKKKLCIKSAKAEVFSLRYLSSDKDTKLVSQASTTNTPHPLFTMPFAIEADSIALKESHLVINNSEISINQVIAQLSIDKSEFRIIKPTAKKLTWLFDKSEKETSTLNDRSTDTINNAFSQLDEIHLPIALDINKLHIDTIHIGSKTHHDKNCQIACSQWLSSNNNLSGTWRNTDVSISEFQTFTDKFSIRELAAEVKLKPPYQISSHSISQHSHVSWWPEIANTNANLSLNGSLEDLNFDLATKGNLTLVTQGKINLINKDMPFELSMNAQKVPTPLSLSHFGDYSSLSVLLSGDLKKQAIELTSQITGYGYTNAHIKVKANRQEDHLNIEHFFFNDIDSASQLNLRGNVTLVPDDIKWQLSAESSGFTFPKIDLTSLPEVKQKIDEIDYFAQNLPDVITGRLQGTITSNGEWTKDAWSITLSNTELSGNINDLPLAIQADFGLDQSGHIQPSRLFIDFNNSTLTLNSAGDSFWDMKGHFTVKNINQWHSDIYGELISDFSVSGKKGKPMIKLKTQLNAISWQDWASNLLVIDVDYQPMENHQLQLSIKNDQLNWRKGNKDYSVDNLAFTVQGNASKHQIKAHWLGDFTGDIALSGHLDKTFSTWQSAIGKSSLRYQKITLETDKVFDVDIDLSSQEVTVGTHCWRSDGLGVCLTNDATFGNSGDLALNLEIDLSTIDELFLPQDTELISQISGYIKLKWSEQEAIAAKANFTMSPGYLKVVDDFNQHKISQWSSSQFTFAVNEQGFTHELVLMDLHNLPLMNSNSSLKFIDDSPIGGSPLKAHIILNNFNLQPLQSVLASVITLEGKVTADISVDGTLGSPLFNGNASLNKGKLRLSKNANTLDNISSSMIIDKNNASIDGYFYLKEKQAKLQGNISWQESLAMNLDLTGTALPLVFPPQLIMAVSPKLNFSLIDKSFSISGDIDVLEGIYNIEKLPESSVSLSDDVIIIDKKGKAIIKESSGFDIKTNINVNIDPAFEISGQGLQGHLFGQLQITQQERQPFQVFGRIQSTKGTFRAYGQKLNIDTGEITFNGPLDNPYLDLRASRHIRAEDIDVGIQVTGFPDELDMKLFSTPTMTMPEMLSYLVRGRSLDAGTENSTVAASFLVGFGASNTVGLFDRIEKIPLVSNIAVDTEGEGEKTQATVSGYLGNRVYLKYGVGVYEPINELTVRMFILNRFWLEIVSGIEQSTDLYYSFYID